MRKLLYILIMLLLVSPVSARSLNYFQVEVVDEIGDAVTHTTLTTVEILDAGTSDTATIYSDSNGETSLTNPIVTGLSDARVEFFIAASSFKFPQQMVHTHRQGTK